MPSQEFWNCIDIQLLTAIVSPECNASQNICLSLRPRSKFHLKPDENQRHRDLTIVCWMPDPNVSNIPNILNSWVAVVTQVGQIVTRLACPGPPPPPPPPPPSSCPHTQFPKTPHMSFFHQQGLGAWVCSQVGCMSCVCCMFDMHSLQKNYSYLGKAEGLIFLTVAWVEYMVYVAPKHI